jgi:hypothetical protein
MATPACLVTSTPSFEPPKRTAPFLVAAGAQPDPRVMISIDERKTAPAKSFTVDVVSEDNGQDVFFRLYVDYGFKPPGTDQPFRALFANIPALESSTMSDTMERTVRFTWSPQLTGTGTGCHTLTLIASHDFDPATQCPKCLSDSSQITWQLYVCDSTKVDECMPDFTDCVMWNESCDSVPNPADKEKCGASP